jgi:hypothetical protein
MPGNLEEYIKGRKTNKAEIAQMMGYAKEAVEEVTQ